MFKRVTLFFLLIVILGAKGVMAQYYNLTVSDPQQSWNSYRGTIEEAVISVSPKGLYSQISMYLTFSARGSSFLSNTQLETVLNFDLPDGSFVSDLWLWIGDQISQGVLLDTWTASSIYEGIVNRRRDPAILFKNGPNNYQLRVYPLLKNESRKVRLTYLVPNTWLASTVTVPLPLQILKTSLNTIPYVKVITWKTTEWANPSIENVGGVFTFTTDSFYGDHYALPISNYNSLSSLTMSFSNPMVNGVYLKYYKTLTEGYYQLALFPGSSLDSVNKKVLFLIDYDSRKSNTTRKQIVDNVKLLLNQYFKSEDKFNIYYSGLNTGKVSDAWISADPTSIDNAFNKFNENSISVYSNLPTLLRDGYDFAIKNGGGAYVYLISNSDQVGGYQSANQLIADIKNILTTNIPTYILDYNDKEYTYYYFSNRSYIGNEYFYDNLARLTGGAFTRLSGTFQNSIVDVYQKIGGSINSFDLYTSMQNGFCFSRQNLNGDAQTAQLSKAITQTGKFIGEFPFIIKTSGIYNSVPVTETKIFQDDNSRITDEVTQKMWAGRYISSLETGQITNSAISEIISVSLTNRILSKYTSFLSLESDTGYCKDCYHDDGNPGSTDVEEESEIPTEFSLEAYPNPFNSQVTITVKLPNNITSQHLTFKIYNILGQVVKTFNIDDVSASSIIKLHWDGKNDFGETVTSGVYVFMVSGNNFNHSLKLMFLK